ncbi:LuxR C-terminal-related transcriptional regulator [Caballeronia sp. LZ001]|uniref:helix-turn-helix transcriptional regulator n=1 Tax=Caballeronia sp. LZ001 TaxID=3038553 RepID=UPI00286236AB|nr:LuxR C-terminal-related transcriptional regulator [Caballeronia sp. LZ001]MDR5800121.1 LuxR C-terminal-related transcriptional regulator [Caballeronia sp. LZ001]
MLECIVASEMNVAVSINAQEAMSDARTVKAVALESSDAAALVDYLFNEETTVVAVDADLNVMCKMSNALALLGDQGGLAIRDGQLMHLNPKAYEGLKASVAKTLACGQCSTIVVTGAWGHAWHIVITRADDVVLSSRPRAVLRIERRHIFRRPEVATLQSVLGLSQAEARMLCELICGHSVNECAAILDVSIATVRKHLAATLKKTSCSRQSELMRLASIVT